MVVQTIYLSSSTRKEKKWMAQVDRKNIHFGAFGYEDYTTHKNQERKNRYINRHRDKENWGKSGITTAGFWSRWILWNRPSLRGSIKDTEKRFNLKIKLTRK